jgi:hypothetical protein
MFSKRCRSSNQQLNSILRVERQTLQPADRVVFLMGSLCWEDFQEILLLSGNGYGIGASKVLRSLYEHAVAAQHVAKHPEAASVRQILGFEKRAITFR